MKKLLKIAGVLVLLLILAIAGLISYAVYFLPNIPVQEDLKVEVTPERVTRGDYLANHVAVCMDCHSTRDWSLFAGPPKNGSLGVGGEKFDQKMGFPGTFVAPNITPHALKDWSDGELYRAITSGVSKDGRAMFPIMPYPAYGKMATEDVYSIIAYVRSLTPVASVTEPSKAAFPMSVIMNTIPKPAQPAEIPAATDSLAFGAYLTNASGCIECHTKMEKGKAVGEPFAGGFVFPMPGGARLVSPNITPHPTTGIGAWTKEQFVARFEAYKKGGPASEVPIKEGEMQSVMPWTMYAGMTSQDLGAIYDYLKSVKPAENLVERWIPAAN